MWSNTDTRVRLLGLREELARALARSRADLEVPAEAPADRTGHHNAEAGTDLYLREWDLTTQRTIERELRAVEDAIDRAERGLYGICAECGRSIEPERLAVRPQAIRRVDCERRRHHPPSGGPRRPRS